MWCLVIRLEERAQHRFENDTVLNFFILTSWKYLIFICTIIIRNNVSQACLTIAPEKFPDIQCHFPEFCCTLLMEIFLIDMSGNQLQQFQTVQNPYEGNISASLYQNHTKIKVHYRTNFFQNKKPKQIYKNFV